MKNEIEAEVTVKIDTDQLKEMIADVASMRLMSQKQVDDIMHWAWDAGYTRGFIHATEGRDNSRDTDNPHKAWVW